MKPTAAQLRQLKKDNLKWSYELAPIPQDEWPIGHQLLDSPRLAVLRSRTFLVQVVLEKGRFLRLSVNRTEWDERSNRFREDISWDDLQRLKREAGYGECAAVEVYPPDADVVNVANMRHLFILESPPPFMWRDDELAAMTPAPPPPPR